MQRTAKIKGGSSMKPVKLPYGKGYIDWPTDNYPVFNLVKPKEVERTNTEQEIIREGIASPYGDKKLSDFSKVKSIAIVTSDNTRVVPNKIIMPLLLDELERVGISTDKVTILIGGGLHPPMSREKITDWLGEDVIKRVKNIYAHDAKNEESLVYLGESSRKTPIYINRHYVEADVRIILGSIDPHQFIGWSGGAKGLVIGLGGEKQIEANHKLLTDPKCELGNIEDNPARLDIDEIGGTVGIDFIINVIVNNKKEVVKVVAGHYLQAHRAGVKIAKELCQVEVGLADLVVASQGGSPKDVNLYQSQKALKHASMVVKQGGVVIILAECVEGVGEKLFEDTMALDSTPKDVIKRFSENPFKIGAHKAFLWARSLERAKVILVADGISEEKAEALMVKKAPTLEKALEMAEKCLPKNYKITIMPKASSTIPLVKINE